jgi:hypothetical protein
MGSNLVEFGNVDHTDICSYTRYSTGTWAIFKGTFGEDIQEIEAKTTKTLVISGSLRNKITDYLFRKLWGA